MKVADTLWTSSDSLLTSNDSLLTSVESLLTSTDSLLTSTDSLLTSTDPLVTAKFSLGHLNTAQSRLEQPKLYADGWDWMGWDPGTD